MSKLTALRDVAAIAAAAGFVAFVIDEIRPVRTPSPTGPAVAPGRHGALRSLPGDTYDQDGQRGRYLRPATEVEAGASRAAASVDGGPGVFGVDRDGTIVLPGSPTWTTALSTGPYGGALSYYRVEA